MTEKTDRECHHLSSKRSQKVIPDRSDKTNSLLRLLHTPHDGGLAVVGALEDAGQDAGHAGVLGLLQPSHHPLLHHADKLLVAELPVPIRVK